MARDQRTRLNAELAHQYGATTDPGNKLVGKGTLTDSEAAEDVEEVEAVAAPKTSVFELPRKEAAPSSLLDDAETSSSTPSATRKP